MKKNELRLGSVVRVKATGEIIRVAGLTSRKVRWHRGDNGRLLAAKYCEVEPVLIREVHHALPPIPELVWADKALCEDLYYYGKMPIVNLHELQNIHFVLTGNEIEIEI